MAGTNDKKPDGKKYLVLSSVGAWVKGNVFSERQFKEMNDLEKTLKPGDPVPDNHPIKNPEPYFAALIDRLLSLEVIRLVPDEMLVSPLPIGPSGMIGGVTMTIAESAASVLRSRKLMKEAVGARAPSVPNPQDRDGAAQGRLIAV